MSFTWVQTISSGASIDRADIMEIRDNADWLHNNIAYCTAHYGTNQASNRASVNVPAYTSNNPAYNNTDNAAYYWGDNAGNESGFWNNYG